MFRARRSYGITLPAPSFTARIEDADALRAEALS